MTEMIANFILELVPAPGTASFALGTAVAHRLPWSAGVTLGLFVPPAQVYYFADDTTQQEWGYGTYTTGRLTRDVVLGNSAGTLAKLNFSSTPVYVYPEIPAERVVSRDPASGDLIVPYNINTSGDIAGQDITATGTVTLGLDPSGPMQASTKNYVDNKGIIVSTIMPAAPKPGLQWFNSADVQTYVYYSDGGSSQWVAASNPSSGTGAGTTPFDFPNLPATGATVTAPSGAVYRYDGTKWTAVAQTTGGTGGITEAPTDGQSYVRRGSTAAWVAQAVASIATPTMDGAASAGASAAWARGDHTHPSDTSKLTQATADGRYYLQSGGPISGNVTVGGGITTTGGGTFGANVLCQSNLTVSASLGVSGSQTLSGGLTVGGAIAISTTTLGTGQFYLTGSPTEKLINWMPNYWDGYNAAVGLRRFILNATQCMTLDTAGNLALTGNGFKPGGGSWGASSDARIKTVLGNYDAGLAEVIQLRPVVYQYLNNHGTADGDDVSVPENDNVYRGLIAQDVETVMPEMVTLSTDTIDGVEVDDFRTLDTTPLTFALVNAIRELNAKIDSLQAQVDQLMAAR